MAPPTIPSAPSQKPPKPTFVTTDTGNKVSRRSQLHGTQHIILGGRTVICADVCIRGDLLPTRPPSTSTTKPPSSSTPLISVSIGRYTYIAPHALLRPPSRPSSRPHPPTVSYTPMRILDHVFVGAHATVEAALVESHVVIGEGAVVGKLAVLKEGCKVLEGAVVPGGMVVPSGAVVGGKPARVLGVVGDGWGVGEWEGEGAVGEGGDLREVWRGVG